MSITLQQLQTIMPMAGWRAAAHLDFLNDAMDEFDIDSVKRQASFLAQIAVESGHLRYVREIASGAAYDTGRLAKNLGNTPEADGDGQRWKGHGFIQITGHDNHEAAARYFDKSMDEIAEWLQTPEGACRSAAWFWKSHGLNELADAGNQVAVSKRVNGGTLGLTERLATFDRAREALS